MMASVEFVKLVVETYRLTDQWSGRQPPISREGMFAMINPANDSVYPSMNGNRIVIHADIPPSDDDLQVAEDAYATANVKRYFAWIMPGDRSDPVAERLVARGWEEFLGPDYLTLVRVPAAISHETNGLAVRKLDVPEATALKDQLRTIQGGKDCLFTRSIGAPECDHFAAFLDDRPVACAMSVRVGPAVYLSSASTDPAYARRGGQSALIAARVSHAQATGASLCFVETLSMLETSLGNLERQGFRRVMWTRVFQRVVE